MQEATTPMQRAVRGLGVVLLLGTGAVLARNARLAFFAASTTGRVVERVDCPKRAAHPGAQVQACPVVAFDAGAGRVIFVHTSLRRPESWYPVGASVPVVYVASAPDTAVVYDRLEFWSPALMLLLGGVMVASPALGGRRRMSSAKPDRR